MISWILSVALYIFTMVIGVYIDKRGDGYRYRNYFILWLYVFLCFGYMTGADWRNYEPLYGYFDDYTIKYINEPGSWLIFRYIPLVIKDFWFFLGIAKCIHLFVLIRLLKCVSERWLTILMFLIPHQVAFILVQNPLRFMVGLTFVYVGIIMFIRYTKGEHQWTKSMLYLNMALCFIGAAMFHNSCMFFILLIPLFVNAIKIQNVNPGILFLVYMILTLVTSNAELVNSIKNGANSLIMGYVAVKDYSETYSVEDSTNILALGNLLKIVFFIFILFTRNSVVYRHPMAPIVYGLAVSYCILDRFFLVIPTGFRLAIPFINFYIVYFVLLLDTEWKRLSQIFILYTFLSFVKTLWTAYDLIPYSNSIPYIVMGHKDYYERHLNNVVEYRERTGNDLILRIDQ